MATEATETTAVAETTTATGTSVSVKRRRGSVMRLLAWYIALSATSLIVLYPVWMTIVRAISEPFRYMNAGQPPYPVATDWGVIQDVWSDGQLPRSMVVSLVVCVAITAGQLLTTVMAAYAFAYLEFPLKRVLFALLLATLLLPIEVTLVANVETIRDLGWLNSWAGLAVPSMASAFGIFLLRQAFIGVPPDLRDAARLDGFSHFTFARRVALPVVRPIVGSLILITALGAWNSYLWPRAVTTEQRWNTVQIALRAVSTANPEQLNRGVAAALISALPVLILLLVFQKQIVRGLTAGSVKG